ncbi:MAG: hypothetical protein PHY34_05305 [Patescibacteria group bacterium]|nr:hypothetical protein [Patescibacteria group bacterium]MDD5716024.1 hypothetical protein [Patescibacteria group bacterium]
MPNNATQTKRTFSWWVLLWGVAGFFVLVAYALHVVEFLYPALGLALIRFLAWLAKNYIPLYRAKKIPALAVFLGVEFYVLSFFVGVLADKLLLALIHAGGITDLLFVIGIAPGIAIVQIVGIGFMLGEAKMIDRFGLSQRPRQIRAGIVLVVALALVYGLMMVVDIISVYPDSMFIQYAGLFIFSVIVSSSYRFLKKSPIAFGA